MVYLKTIKRGDTTYYYLAKRYHNKFGRKHERVILRIDQEDLSNLDVKKQQARALIQEQEAREDLFEAYIHKYGLRQAKERYINFLNVFHGLPETMGEKHWEWCVETFERITGKTLYKKNIPPPKRKRGRPRLPEGKRSKRINVRFPLGIMRTLNRIKHVHNKDSQVAVAREAIFWLASKIETAEIYSESGSVRVFDPETVAIIAECSFRPPRSYTSHYRTFWLKREPLNRLRVIQNTLGTWNRNHTLILCITLYSKSLGLWSKVLCEYEQLSGDKYRNKKRVRVYCRLEGKKYAPSWCLKCQKYRGVD